MKKWTSLLALAFLLFFVSCNEMDKYYDNEAHSTSVSVGNAWDYLESKGNFTNFLAAVDKAGYKSLVSGTGLATIFAPDDEAFQKYFARHGYTTLEEVPDAEMKDVITYHLLYYAFNAERFMEYKPRGTTATDKYVGLYYKYRTKSRDVIEYVDDPSVDEERPIFHSEKMVPVFTPNLFQWYEGSTGAINYDYFYGAGVWQGDNWVRGNEPYFRVSNAGVKEYGIITDNGYIHILDDVVEPLKTIHQAMGENENYSIYAKAYDRFKDIAFYSESDISQNYGNGDSLFNYEHLGLYSIAQEWPTSYTANAGPDARNLGNLSSGSLAIFAPTNAVMDEFFNKYWAKYYGSIDSVNFIPLMAMMGETLVSHRLNGTTGPLLPSEITKGNAVSGISNSVISVDLTGEVQDKAFCSNGIFYGVNKLVVIPKYFSYVTAPAFVNPDYNMFLLLMTRAGILDLYTAENQTFYAFYPSDALLKKTPVSADNTETLIYENPQPFKYGFETITFSDGEATAEISRGNAARIVQSQICDKMIEVAGTDEKIYRTTYNTFNYIYQKGDSIFSTAKYNQHYGKPGTDYYDMNTVEEITSELPEVRNGRVFALKGERNASALLPEDREFAVISPNQAQVPWEFLETTAGGRNFYTTMINTSLNDSTGRLEVMNKVAEVDGAGARYIVFALSNQAVVNAWSKKIITNGFLNYSKNYLPNLFVSVTRSRLVDYPFPGDGMGTRTLYTYKTNANGEYSTIQLDDMGTHLQLTDSKGRTVKVKNSFPYIYDDCAVYIIEDYIDFGDEFNKVK